MEFGVDTPEAVSVAYTIAGIGSRFVAALLDVVIQCVLLVLIITGIAGLSGLPGPARTVALVLLITLLFILFWGYYLLFEAFWNGQTPGKSAAHIRVLKTSGHPIGFAESAIRNLLRLVDFLPGFYALGVITMFVNRESRRLGDLAAGTVVVRVPRRARAAVAAPVEPVPRSVAPRGTTDPDEMVWNVRALSPADMALIEEFLGRVGRLPLDARERVGRSIASTVAARIGAREPGDSAVFLRRVVELRASEDAEPSAPYSLR